MTEEIALDDALAANDSAVEAIGDANLKVITAELITEVRTSVTIALSQVQASGPFRRPSVEEP